MPESFFCLAAMHISEMMSSFLGMFVPLKDLINVSVLFDKLTYFLLISTFGKVLLLACVHRS